MDKDDPKYRMLLTTLQDQLETELEMAMQFQLLAAREPAGRMRERLLELAAEEFGHAGQIAAMIFEQGGRPEMRAEVCDDGRDLLVTLVHIEALEDSLIHKYRILGEIFEGTPEEKYMAACLEAEANHFSLIRNLRQCAMSVRGFDGAVCFD